MVGQYSSGSWGGKGSSGDVSGGVRILCEFARVTRQGRKSQADFEPTQGHFPVLEGVFGPLEAAPRKCYPWVVDLLPTGC